MSFVKRPLIIDTDPGIDDAVAIAIALFSEELDVKLITTVTGNVALNLVTDNALKLLKHFGKKIPVAAGSPTPLLRPFVDASNVHGASGMEGYDFEPGDTSLLLNEHAVTAMRRVLMESPEPMTIMAIGPLTNVALLLNMYPEVRKKIAEIVLMGGSLNRGNRGVMSEFNIDCDPEAAKMVFASGMPLVVAPLDVGFKALVYPEDSEQIKEMNHTGEMMYSLFKRYRGGSMKTGLKMYDSCAIAYILRPDMYEVAETFVDVELAGTYTAGCTVIDLKGYLKKPANAKVCVDIDPDKFKSWFLESIKKCN